MLVKHLRKGVKAARYTLDIIIISVRGATCCIWARVAAPGAEEITAMAGHRSLDWYYRCNIVNNVPLSAFSARERPRLCPCGVHGMVTSLPDRPTGARQHPLPGPSTSVTSVYCWIFILQSRAHSRQLVSGEHEVSTYYSILYQGWPYTYRNLSPCFILPGIIQPR